MSQRSKLPFTISPDYRRESFRKLVEVEASALDPFNVFDALLYVTIAAIVGAFLGVML